MWGVVVRAVCLVFGLCLPVERARLIVAGLYHVNWIMLFLGGFPFFLFLTYMLNDESPLFFCKVSFLFVCISN